MDLESSKGMRTLLGAVLQNVSRSARRTVEQASGYETAGDNIIKQQEV